MVWTTCNLEMTDFWPFIPEMADFRLKSTDFLTERAEFTSRRADFGVVRAVWSNVRVDFRAERTEFEHKIDAFRF